MATKISALPETTSPGSSVELAVVDSGTTKHTTASNLAPAIVDTRLGWFDVGHNGADQTSIGTTEVKILVDGALTFQGGYDNLPEGITSTQVYDTSTSRIKTDWLDEGQAFLVRVTGELTTSTANTSAIVHFNFYDSTDTLLFTLSANAGYFKSTGARKFSAIEMVFVSSSVATTGAYMEVGMEFDTGSANEIDMGGFTLAVLK